MCPVLSRSSLKQQHIAKPKQDDREVPSKKVVMPKTGIPPARIPEITSRSQTGMTRTDAHRSHRYAEQCEKYVRVLSCVLWRSSSTYTVARLLKISASHKRAAGYIIKRYCCTLSCSPYVTKLNS